MVYQVQADDGSLLDAHFEVDGHTIVFHSRGGSKGVNATNVDYTPALRVLLSRLSLARMPVERAWVDSSRVQSMPVADRIILDAPDAELAVAEQVSRMGARMQAIGRQTGSKSAHGNSTKRIRLQLSTNASEDAILAVLKGVRSNKDLRSADRLPASELEKVTPEHLWRAVLRLQGGFTDHGFGDSTDYDVLLQSGDRLPPKAVVGLAASEALGRLVQPRNFTGGAGSVCFRLLEEAGYRIVPKKTETTAESEPARTDQEWIEGTPKLRLHLSRERADGAREAKKAQFRRVHGRLFCERCKTDPVESYGTEHAEACIEVHHSRIQIAEMDEGHRTLLDDLQCLCANCHRLEHRLIRKQGTSEDPRQVAGLGVRSSGGPNVPR